MDIASYRSLANGGFLFSSWSTHRSIGFARTGLVVVSAVRCRFEAAGVYVVGSLTQNLGNDSPKKANRLQLPPLVAGEWRGEIARIPLQCP